MSSHYLLATICSTWCREREKRDTRLAQANPSSLGYCNHHHLLTLKCTSCSAEPSRESLERVQGSPALAPYLHPLWSRIHRSKYITDLTVSCWKGGTVGNPSRCSSFCKRLFGKGVFFTGCLLSVGMMCAAQTFCKARGGISCSDDRVNNEKLD